MIAELKEQVAKAACFFGINFENFLLIDKSFW